MPGRRLIQRSDEQNRKRRDHSDRPHQRYNVFRMVSTGSRFQRPHDRYVSVHADRYQSVCAHLQQNALLYSLRRKSPGDVSKRLKTSVLRRFDEKKYFRLSFSGKHIYIYICSI